MESFGSRRYSVPLTEASFRWVSWPRGQDCQARPCLDLRLDDDESLSLVFRLTTNSRMSFVAKVS